MLNCSAILGKLKRLVMKMKPRQLNIDDAITIDNLPGHSSNGYGGTDVAMGPTNEIWRRIQSELFHEFHTISRNQRSHTAKCAIIVNKRKARLKPR